MIAVRLATMDDAEIIARQTSRVQQLHNDALPDIFKLPSAGLFPEEKLAALLKDRNSVVAVAEMDGKIVGHIYGAVVNRAENAFNQPGAYLYIHQIAVDDDARRKGVGTALIAFIRDRARALGLSAVHVDHWAFNARASAFFGACGFSPLKVIMRQVLKDDRSI
jgi:GNAT superfamily N-acetyltransferase